MIRQHRGCNRAARLILPAWTRAGSYDAKSLAKAGADVAITYRCQYSAQEFIVTKQSLLPDNKGLNMGVENQLVT